MNKKTKIFSCYNTVEYRKYSFFIFCYKSECLPEPPTASNKDIKPLILVQSVNIV